MRQKGIRGFTMVELLVALAIIGLLIATAIWGIGLAQQGARNTQRRTAAAMILAGMSECYSRGGAQPTTIAKSTIGDIDLTCGTKVYSVDMPATGTTSVGALNSGAACTTNSLTTTNSTEYFVANVASGYKVCACLEGASVGSANLSSPSSISCP